MSGLGERVWEWIKKDSYFIKFGFKASVPPGILLCLVTSHTWLERFGTLSYLAPIIAACAFPTFPQAKLIRLHAQLALCFAVSYAYVLLAAWSGLQARFHTTTAETVTVTYNASAAAVVAIWFFVYFYLVFAIKAAYPTWQLPSTVAAIFTAAILPGLALDSTWADIFDSTNTLIEVCLIGQAGALVVGLILFPWTCRMNFSKDMSLAIKAVVNLCKAHSEALADVTNPATEGVLSSAEGTRLTEMKHSLKSYLAAADQAKGDWLLAKEEFGIWERIYDQNTDELYTCISGLIPLLSGLVSTAEMLHTARENALQHAPGETSSADEIQNGNYNQNDSSWIQMCREMQVHSKTLAGECHHLAQELEEILRPTTTSDKLFGSGRVKYEESGLEKGTSGQSSDAVANGREQLVQNFMDGRSKLIHLDPEQQHRIAVNYLMVINEQSMLQLTSSSLQGFLRVAHRISSTRKLVVLPWYIVAPFSRSKQRTGTQSFPDDVRHARSIFFRVLHQLFRTEHAGFGLRGAFAMMSIAITAFLKASAEAYASQRFVWALFAILFSLNERAGSSSQSLFFRFAGTSSSMLASYFAWYVADQKTSGTLVFIWIWFAILGFLWIRFPHIQSSWFIAMIAAITMIGNEIQVRVLGKEAVEAAGQAVYPPYILFPYRLAIVTMGIVAAYIWSLFPAPLTEHRELRRCLARSTMSLAKFHLVARETVDTCFFRNKDERDNLGASNELIKAQSIHFSSFQQSTAVAKGYLKYLDWEFLGRHLISKGSASQILDLTGKIMNQLCLSETISRSVVHLQQPQGRPNSNEADNDAVIRPHLCPTGITSRILDLSNALIEGQVLAPELNDLRVPDIVEFLRLNCSSNERFAAAALIHAANSYMIQDLAALTNVVSNVSGTLNYHV